MLTVFMKPSHQESQHMLSQEDHVEISALRRRGWTYSAIARHVGVSRNTVKAYLRGLREPGRRQPADPDRFQPFVEYLQIRLRDDPHVWGSALYDEVCGLGYEQSYVTFVRQVRLRGLRPDCDRCAGNRSRATIEIDHEPGEEIQWDWEELPAPWGGTAYLLQGRLPFSGRTRGVFAESDDQPHLAEGIDGVLRRLGGTARVWRVDRMSTAVYPKTGKLLPSFAAVARYYSVSPPVRWPRRHPALARAPRGPREGGVGELQQRSALPAQGQPSAQHRGSRRRRSASGTHRRRRGHRPRPLRRADGRNPMNQHSLYQ